MEQDINGSRLRRDSVVAVLLSIVGTAVLGVVAWAFNMSNQITTMQVQIISMKEDVGALKNSTSVHDGQIIINTQRLNELERERK